MKNLIGFLKKTLLLSSFLALFFPFVKNVNASELLIYSDFYHNWDGNTVNSTIYLTLTSTSPSVISSYIISIPDTTITPNVFLVNRNTTLEPTIHRSSNMTNITLDLQNTPVYPDKPVTLKLTYSTLENSKSLSLLSSILDTKVRTFSLTYPSSLGEITWSSAPINSVNTKGDKTEIITTTPQTDKVGISLGSEIIYRYVIEKNLLNSSDEILLSEIKLPLNNNYQHITVENYTPKPDKSYKDGDGNYILQYSLAPLSTMDVKIEGYILMNKTEYVQPLSFDILSPSLWKITDTSLIRHVNRYLDGLGLKLPETFSSINDLEKEEEKDLLYKGIYSYVVENLEPNILTIGSLAGSERLGGQENLLKQSSCTNEDYADSLISLYRHYGIPARLVIGYISTISNYHPEGMYHYWVEYLNKQENDWIIVEPFLEDYSNTSLLNRDMKDHIALIYRDTNPNLPKLPYFTTDDFQVELTQDIPKLNHDIDIELILEPYSISNPYLSGSILIKNTGNAVFDDFVISESNPDLSKYIDYIENNSQIILLPNQSHSIKFHIPSDEVVENMFASVDVLSGTYKVEGEYIEYDLEIVKDYKGLDTLAKLLSILLFIILCVSVYFIFIKVKLKNE